MKKFDALRQSFDRKFISPDMSRDAPKHLFDLCMCHRYLLFWSEKFEEI